MNPVAKHMQTMWRVCGSALAVTAQMTKQEQEQVADVTEPLQAVFDRLENFRREGLELERQGRRQGPDFNLALTPTEVKAMEMASEAVLDTVLGADSVLEEKEQCRQDVVEMAAYVKSLLADYYKPKPE